MLLLWPCAGRRKPHPVGTWCLSLFRLLIWAVGFFSKLSEQAHCHLQGVLSALSVPDEPPFALRDKGKSAATSRGGRMLCRNLSLGFLWLPVDTQMVTALPPVLVIASRSAGVSPEGVQPPLPLYGHAAPPLMQSWVLVIATVDKITAQPPLIGKTDSSETCC